MAETYNWENGVLLNAPVFPKTTVEYQSLLDSNDFSKLEDLLMERFETIPHDIAFFLPAYRLFIKKQETERASALLGLHVESLRARGDLTSEIVLLQAMLGFWPGCRYAVQQLLGHCKAMYAQSANFGKYTRHLQISAETEGVEKLRQLELWLRYDEGRVVYVPSRGVVQIGEANTKIGVVRMDFDSGEHMSLRLDEAERLAQPFTDSHFLARTIIDRDALRQTAADDPGELLRLFFASVKREVGLSELREMLAGIVGEPEWNTWWTRVRKDPRLIVGAGTKPQLNWNDSIAEGSAGLMVTFLKAQTREKIDMLKKYAARSESMAMEMAQSLFSEAAEMLDNDPSFALEIVLTVDGLSQCKGVLRPFAVEERLCEADAVTVIGDIEDRSARKKAVQLVGNFQAAWPGVYAGLFKTEPDTSLLKFLYEALRHAGHETILAAEVQRVFSSPTIFSRCYLWLCKELPRRPELQKQANGEFIRTLLGLMDDPAFRGHHAVLRKLFDPGEAVDRAIETLDAPGGRSLLDVLSRNRELENYIKENIRLKLFSLFPVLRETKH